jgi:23S rRNA pseudouridine2605 synthase
VQKPRKFKPSGKPKTPRQLKTLDRVLSKAGLGSRTEARGWIGAGRVAVNGKIIQTPDHWVDVARDRVTLDRRPISAARKIYLLLYKPKGYLTTYKDPEGRKTVYDLLPEFNAPSGAAASSGSVVGSGIAQVPSAVRGPGEVHWIFPAGRLDQDTSGLLIMTNDTDFGDFITSPESKVAKTYLVKSSTLLTEEQLDRLRNGVELADGPTRPAIVKRIRDSGRYTFFEITITEGRNRQVRRMVDAIGAKVLKLVRVRFGEISIGDLQIGKHRELTAVEVNQLYGRPDSGRGVFREQAALMGEPRGGTRESIRARDRRRI